MQLARLRAVISSLFCIHDTDLVRRVRLFRAGRARTQVRAGVARRSCEPAESQKVRRLAAKSNTLTLQKCVYLLRLADISKQGANGCARIPVAFGSD